MVIFVLLITASCISSMFIMMSLKISCVFVTMVGIFHAILFIFVMKKYNKVLVEGDDNPDITD